MSRPTQVHLNSAALTHNLRQVRVFAPHTKVMAMAKANAYGHGFGHLLTALTEADSIGVCSIEEAIEARELGVKLPIVLVEGCFEAAELAHVATYQFEIVVHHWRQIEMLQHTQISQPITVWLKIDTGMHRLGFSLADAGKAWNAINEIKQVRKPFGIMTHLACADEITNPMTKMQLQQFQRVTEGLPGQRSIANSAGIIAWPDTRADWVRPGIMLYGISPFEEHTGLEYGLQPVMTLCSQLIAIRSCRKGEPIGYGATYRCPEDMLIGVVAMGYGDGYPRHAVSGTPVLVNNQQVSLVGRISMDMLTVDLTTQPHAKVGDPVILWGEGLPIEKVARCAKTNPYELVCAIKKRVSVVCHSD